MKIDITINKREYTIAQETPTGPFSVTGQVRSASGALMPRLEEALRDYFKKENIPAGGLIGLDVNNPETLIFAFHRGKTESQLLAELGF